MTQQRKKKIRGKMSDISYDAKIASKSLTDFLDEDEEEDDED